MTNSYRSVFHLKKNGQTKIFSSNFDKTSIFFKKTDRESLYTRMLSNFHSDCDWNDNIDENGIKTKQTRQIMLCVNIRNCWLETDH